MSEWVYEDPATVTAHLTEVVVGQQLVYPPQHHPAVAGREQVRMDVHHSGGPDNLSNNSLQCILRVDDL
jgi:hypothetical protein